MHAETQASRPEPAEADETWLALSAYDPEIRAAVERLAPLGPPALDELRRTHARVPDKRALPDIVAAIEGRWAAHAEAGLAHVETRDGVAVLRDGAGRYHVAGRQTAELSTARLMAAATARRARSSSLAGLAVGAVVLAAMATGAGPARAQAPTSSGAVTMTVPSCETYRRERPRGGSFEQISQLFGLSIYRWEEADYARYRSVLLDCKRALPDFRADVTGPQWEAITDQGVANIKTYTGYVNRLGEPMAGQRGPRPRRGEPDPTFAFEALPCDRFTQTSVGAWGRGGAPGYGSEAPFGVPAAAWGYEVWRAFENRVLACGRASGSPAEADADWMRAVVVGMEGRAAPDIRRARQDEAVRATKLAGILGRLAEAERLAGADDIAAALQGAEAQAAAGPRLTPADEDRVAAARERVAARLRGARAAEAEAWERDRPAREARARGQEAELAELQRRNREREAEAAGERELAAGFEAERQATARAQEERRAAEAAAQVQGEVDERAAQRRAQERSAAETAARIQREEEAALAVDPCNRVEVRRQLMTAANGMDRARYGGRKLLDLTRGRSNPADPGATRSCLFEAEWSSGERGLVWIAVRKNSFGDELIEVRP